MHYFAATVKNDKGACPVQLWHVILPRGNTIMLINLKGSKGNYWQNGGDTRECKKRLAQQVKVLV